MGSIQCSMERKDKTALNTCISAKNLFDKGENSGLFLAQKLHYTPNLVPSLHSSVLHTDFDMSDVTACCEITRKGGKESTCVQ